MKFLFFLIFSFSISLSAKEYNVAVAKSLPPFVFEDSQTGIELELVREVFASLGHKVNFRFFDLKEIGKQLDNPEIDVALTLNTKLASVHLSDDYITYQNVAVTLKSNKFKIASLGDITRFSIGAFANSKKYLGRDFEFLSSENPKFKEYTNQEEQVKSLYNGDYQVFIGDINIFKYYVKNQKLDLSMVEVHNIFPPSHFQAGFKNESLRNNFNKALDKYKRSSKYKALKSKYSF